MHAIPEMGHAFAFDDVGVVEHDRRVTDLHALGQCSVDDAMPPE
jgi:hypothetical protein